MKENKRPCKECTKRGIALTCVDGARKHPKYLGDLSANVNMASVRHNSPSLWTSDHEFIELATLHTRNLNSGCENHAGVTLLPGYTNKTLALSGDLEQSPWADIQPSQYQKKIKENRKEPTEGVSGEICLETLAIGTPLPPEPNMDNCNEHANEDVRYRDDLCIHHK